VILFVLRLLKAMHFQPRMALVTRTIAVAFSDLVHFAALFGVVFVGYMFAGVLMFGHQYPAFSNMSGAAQFLIVILLSLDTTQFHVQLLHSSPSATLYYIYLWTWIFLALFMLLNIFLAILIEGYTAVKKSGHDARSMTVELGMVLTYEWGMLRSTVRRLMGQADADDFIHDGDLRDALVDYLKGWCALALTSPPSAHRMEPPLTACTLAQGPMASTGSLARPRAPIFLARTGVLASLPGG